MLLTKVLYSWIHSYNSEMPSELDMKNLAVMRGMCILCHHLAFVLTALDYLSFMRGFGEEHRKSLQTPH